ncbi:hypothetical protein BDV95DRAFT_584935 [Massariosphaeria phaeospora]|uniref:Uncharacterized protein n=1 Tax=Massariosphaeria phaeospora TaxID=100035 RepID=A0A7C8M2X6_9PLEO|nr:hypothetical protein BDV95DRAFT_584935 [Massariosphaeria phaeospora]
MACSLTLALLGMCVNNTLKLAGIKQSNRAPNISQQDKNRIHCESCIPTMSSPSPPLAVAFADAELELTQPRPERRIDQVIAPWLELNHQSIVELQPEMMHARQRRQHLERLGRLRRSDMHTDPTTEFVDMPTARIGLPTADSLQLHWRVTRGLGAQHINIDMVRSAFSDYSDDDDDQDDPAADSTHSGSNEPHNSSHDEDETRGRFPTISGNQHAEHETRLAELFAKAGISPPTATGSPEQRSESERSTALLLPRISRRSPIPHSGTTSDLEAQDTAYIGYNASDADLEAQTGRRPSRAFQKVRMVFGSWSSSGTSSKR